MAFVIFYHLPFPSIMSLCTEETRGRCFRLKEGRVRSDIRKRFSLVRVVSPWHKVPREAVGAPALELFKAGLDVALNNLG